MQPAHGTRDGTQASGNRSSPAPLRKDMTLGDLRREAGERWDITRITGGYRATLRQTRGHTPIPRYGRTPAELAESIRMAEHQP